MHKQLQYLTKHDVIEAINEVSKFGMLEVQTENKLRDNSKYHMQPQRYNQKNHDFETDTEKWTVAVHTCN